MFSKDLYCRHIKPRASHSVFKRLVLQTHKTQGLCGKGLKNCRAKNRSYYRLECPTSSLKNLVDVLPHHPWLTLRYFFFQYFFFYLKKKRDIVCYIWIYFNHWDFQLPLEEKLFRKGEQEKYWFSWLIFFSGGVNYFQGGCSYLEKYSIHLWVWLYDWLYGV